MTGFRVVLVLFLPFSLEVHGCVTFLFSCSEHHNAGVCRDIEEIYML